MAEYSPTDYSTAVRSAVVYSLSQHFAQQLFLCQLDTLRLLIVQSLVMKSLRLDFPTTVLDQTMSYQLIQTTSFAMHPRLVEYNAEALVWIYCSCLLVSCDRWLSTQRASAESLARRQNAVVSTYVNDIVLLSLSPSTYLLVNSSLRLDFLLYDVASLLRLDVQATCWL
ncbi:hypothetical protein F511_15880 [Dorcoceras hygrometricum]|uniref:Uncharacterized protein n=1 Tax=Dorcoceras hygrometricum TaxID=472368 RepID=A0A2Z7B6M2_9LAMI|nr:hypothetical protein F511_15880 [Dorcoceras hygrometricum]